MASFKMCAHCQAEYDDPLDRRFHAQPNACYACGPMLQLLSKDGVLHDGNPVAKAIQWLQNGAILAVKGLGGFHLATDACQPNAVEELRRRKHRGEKPFAVMVRDLAAAQEFCTVTNDEALLLQSPQRPIVLLAKRSALFDSLAPDGNQLGLFLPYTPLHHLLLATSSLRALVMTSANLSEEPIAIDNQEALTRLKDIADFFLVHNREILLRCDDSVARSLAGRTQFVRRSRGYVPSPVILRDTQPCVLAVGGELKNTICLSRGRYAFPGQHIGDLENLSAYSFFQESISHFQQILEVTPVIIAHDLHPAYLATRWAKSQNHLPILGIQHHHAHIASCMAENHLVGPVIGIALDGTGYGTDGHAWGCEVLVADLGGFERAAHLQYIPMPGAAQAIHEPWRMAVSYLWQTFGKDWQSHASPSFLSKIPPSSLTIIEQILTSGAHAPLTSSCGRLFDAVAALVCNRTTVTYEAQAAIALRSLLRSRRESRRLSLLNLRARYLPADRPSSSLHGPCAGSTQSRLDKHHQSALPLRTRRRPF
jgi:hydrogenase maturation protein HypF